MSDFTTGFAVAICYVQMFQDLLGKERYLKVVDAAWMNDPWWIWVLIAAFCVSMNLWNKKESKK